MKFSTKLVVGAGAMALAGSVAMAQEVKSEKEAVAPLQLLLPNSYGSLQLRHEVDTYMTDDEVDNQIPNVSVRPKLGSKFFDGVLNTYFVGIFQKDAGTDTINKVGVYNETFLDLYSAGDFYSNIYGYFDQAQGSDWANLTVGPTIGFSPSFELGFGKISTDAYNNFRGNFQPTNSASTSTVKDQTGIAGGFSLAKDLEDGEKPEIQQRDPTLVNETGVTAKLTPAALTKFSTTLGVISSASYKPKYVAKLVDDEETIDLDGYSVSRTTMTLFNLGYKLTDTVSLTNSFRHYTKGFYEAGRDDNDSNKTKRWENRIYLNATLF